MNHNTLKHKARAFASAITLVLISPAVSAHSGHSHAQFDGLTGILHVLTTHPMLFAATGLVLAMLVLNVRD